MISNKLGYIWSPLFFTFFLYEQLSPGIAMCGSISLTGQMWLMWLMMSLSASGKYIELIEKQFLGVK